MGSSSSEDTVGNDGDIMSSPIPWLALEASALQPLFLRSAPRAGNHQDSRSYVTGSTLRGALAARWIAEFEKPNEVFQELFLSALAWPALIPAGHVVVPMSVRRCKYRRLMECQSVAVDTFSPDLGDSLSSMARDLGCPHCNGPLELAKGELAAFHPQARFTKMSRTATELTDDETVSAGDLFTRDGLAAGTLLCGSTPIHEPLSDTARRWVSSLEGATIRVGGRRSVAGALQITSLSWPETTAPPALQSGSRIAIRLQAPAVIVDSHGATSTEVSDALSNTKLDARVRVIPGVSHVRPSILGGWNALAGVPRPDDLAWAPGSTIIAEVSDPNGLSSLDLRSFVVGGIGLRRSEGCGTIAVDTAAWQFPTHVGSTTLVDQKVDAAESDLPKFLRLLEELDGDNRRHAADWFADRLASFARRIQSGTPNRNDLAAAALLERHLRTFSGVLVEAYHELLIDTSLDHAALERLARIASLIGSLGIGTLTS